MSRVDKIKKLKAHYELGLQLANELLEEEVEAPRKRRNLKEVRKMEFRNHLLCKKC